MKLAYCLSPAPKPTLKTRTLEPAPMPVPVPVHAWRRTAWTLADWLDHARQIEGRRISRHQYAAAGRHLTLFPANLIGVELDRPLLRELRRFFVTSHPSLFGRPARRFRGNAPQTP